VLVFDAKCNGFSAYVTMPEYTKAQASAKPGLPLREGSNWLCVQSLSGHC